MTWRWLALAWLLSACGSDGAGTSSTPPENRGGSAGGKTGSGGGTAASGAASGGAGGTLAASGTGAGGAPAGGGANSGGTPAASGTGAGGIPAGGAGAVEFVHVNRAKGTFEYKACEFRASGATIYPANDARQNKSLQWITGVMELTHASGINLIRVTDITNDPDVYSDLTVPHPPALGEPVWSKVDWVLAEAKRLGMFVILDLSWIPASFNAAPGLCTPACKTCCDFTDPVTYPRTNSFWSFVPNRVNSFTGVKYRDDPTIFSYAVTGEPMPYGRQYNADGTVKVGAFAGRDVALLEQFSRNASKLLRENDPNHMVSTGGYNHLDGPKDAAGKTAWEGLSSDDLFDYGAVHVYDNPSSGSYLQGYDWTQWNQFQDELRALGKPFIVEETGVHYPVFANDDAAQGPTRAFFTNGFAWAKTRKMPVFIVWNWTPETDAYDYSVNPNSIHPIVRDVAVIQKNAASVFTVPCDKP